MIKEVYSLRATEDEKQEVALRLWQRIKEGKASANHKAEAATILRNIRVDAIRRQKVLAKNLILVQPLMEGVWNEDPLLYDESAYPPPIRQVVALLRQGYRIKEIASLLGLSVRAVYARIEAAKKL